MYKKIVVPLDGSQLAELPLEYVNGLAAASDAQVTLLHVCPPEESEVERMHGVYLEHLEHVFRSRLQEAGSKGPIVESAVLLGHPAEEILKYVKKNKASLIAMTTHGRSGVQRWALGSVADKVARHSSVPVWLVRCDVPEEVIRAEWPEKKILVLLDGSKRAERVLPYVAEHAKMSGAEVTLLRVCEPPTIPADYPVSMPLTWEEHVEAMTTYELKECRRDLARPVRRLRRLGITATSDALVGNACGEIINYIDENDFDLVGLTSHGRSGVARWALGSVAERVLHACPVPLLLVRAQ
jgi:nucleotide-binding universal stress UspA family protein